MVKVLNLVMIVSTVIFGLVDSFLSSISNHRLKKKCKNILLLDLKDAKFTTCRIKKKI